MNPAEIKQFLEGRGWQDPALCDHNKLGGLAVALMYYLELSTINPLLLQQLKFDDALTLYAEGLLWLSAEDMPESSTNKIFLTALNRVHVARHRITDWREPDVEDFNHAMFWLRTMIPKESVVV